MDSGYNIHMPDSTPTLPRLELPEIKDGTDLTPLKLYTSMVIFKSYLQQVADEVVKIRKENKEDADSIVNKMMMLAMVIIVLEAVTLGILIRTHLTHLV